MLRIAIVEDEEDQRKVLAEYIRQYFRGHDEVELYEYRDGEEFLQESTPIMDILFLDIVMKHSNGMDTARAMRLTNKKTLLIFVTEMFQYALEGYSVDALDFLIKPVYYSSFCVSMKKALDVLHDRMPQMFCITFDKTTSLVDIASITYLETEGKRILIHAKSGDYPCTEPMKVLEEKLEPYGFVRCHQAYLVNVRYVDSIRKTELTLDGATIPVSRYKREEFLRKMARFVGGIL